MIKSNELSDPSSCINKARDGEMVFVLLARDAAAPHAIRVWIEERIRTGKNEPNDEQILEAHQCIQAMIVQRTTTATPGRAGARM